MNIDLSFSRSALVLPKEHSHLKIVIIGAGGTGSFAAQAIARLVFELKEHGKSVEMLIVDPDRVERGNIPRSNFCSAEIGKFKAQTLAERLALAWSLQVCYGNESFDSEKHLKQEANTYRQLTILVGCVDNHRARLDIHRALEESEGYRSSEAANTWWIDGGNGKFSGQVLIGSTVRKFATGDCFAGSTICRKLPAPSLIHPELLQDQESGIARRATERISCPDLVRLGEQSLNINQRVAVEIAEMLSSFLLTGSLRRFASYFDLESGSSRSLYCTPQHIEKALQLSKVLQSKPGKR